MTHCTSMIVAFRFACSAGNATFTTVPSMNAMLEARIVATSTQRALDFGHGAVAGRDRITFSSQGSPKIANIFSAYHCSRWCSPNGFPKLILAKCAVEEIKISARIVRGTASTAADWAGAAIYLTIFVCIINS